MFDNKKYQKQYYLKNKEKILEKAKRYYEEHIEEKREKSKEYSKRYREKYPERIAKWQREYGNQLRNKYNRKKKQYIDEYKLSKGCSVCGYNECVGALEFHHNGDKEFCIGTAIYTESLETIKKEIEKCIILCANCHRELHYKLKVGGTD